MKKTSDNFVSYNSRCAKKTGFGVQDVSNGLVMIR